MGGIDGTRRHRRQRRHRRHRRHRRDIRQAGTGAAYPYPAPHRYATAKAPHRVPRAVHQVQGGGVAGRRVEHGLRSEERERERAGRGGGEGEEKRADLLTNDSLTDG